MAIGTGWKDGAWVDAGWIAAAWSDIIGTPLKKISGMLASLIVRRRMARNRGR